MNGSDDSPASPNRDHLLDVHALLASIPFASATPIAHVARHLSTMSITGPIPILAQPHLYPGSQLLDEDFKQRNAVMGAQVGPVSGPQRQVWDGYRAQAGQLLNEQANLIQPPPNTYYNHAQDASRHPPTFNAQTHWAASTYTPPPLAQSLIHSSYYHPYAPPLPAELLPPPSSLSNAMGPAPPQQKFQLHAPASTVYSSTDSASFYDDFLKKTMQERSNAAERKGNHYPLQIPRGAYHATLSQIPHITPNPPRNISNINGAVMSDSSLLPPSSSDFLPQTPLDTHANQNLLKRKPTNHLASPSVKRIHSSGVAGHHHQLATSERTPKQESLRMPSSASSPAVLTPYHNANAANMNQVHPQTPYIELPLTPSHHRRTNHTVIPPSQSTPSILESSVRTNTVFPLAKLDPVQGHASSGMELDVSEEDELDLLTPRKTGPKAAPQDFGSSVRASVSKPVKMVDKDENAPLHKLLTLIDDIFDAEDSLPSDSGPDVSPAAFSNHFSQLSYEPSRPLLSISTIARLTKLIGQIARPTRHKHHHHSRSAHPPSSHNSSGGQNPTAVNGGDEHADPMRDLKDIDSQTLSRLLRVLSRSVSIGEDLDPFLPTSPSHLGPLVRAMNVTGTGKEAGSKKTGGGKKGKAAKGKGGKKQSTRSRSRSVTGGEDDDNDDDDDDDDAESAAEDKGGAVDDADLEALETVLSKAQESVAAAGCCIALLSADMLAKELYSEELIASCMTATKNQLTKVLFPFIEGTSDVHGFNAPILQHLLTNHSPLASARRQQIGEIFQLLVVILPTIDALITRLHVSMSWSITETAVYIAIGPLFVSESGSALAGGTKKEKEKANALMLNTLGGPSALRGLRLSSISLIRSIFEHHPNEQQWIIEEILMSLSKLPDLKQSAGQFRLRDGHSIHTVSALLVQLVQTAAHGVAIEAAGFIKQRRTLTAQQNASSNPTVTEALISEMDEQEIQTYRKAHEAPILVAGNIVRFLTSRSGKGKATKTANESEYRAIFETLINDLLAVLYWPEWPGASILLQVAVKVLMTALGDTSSSSAADTNGLKSIALDHLGTIGSRLRQCQIQHTDSPDGDNTSARLRSIDTIVRACDIKAFETLVLAHDDIMAYLMKSSLDDAMAAESAKELTTSLWGQELATATSACNAKLQSLSEGTPEYDSYHALARRFKSALQTIWRESSSDVFADETDYAHLDALSDNLGNFQPLTKAFDVILKHILASLSATAVFMRTKALRALGLIVTIDTSVLARQNVQAAIEVHLKDNSPAVRDAAIELVGKYIISHPNIAGNYYAQIADRIADTGIAVRKRVIKLLRSLYSVETSRERRIDICFKLVGRFHDEEEAIQDLAVKTLGELWFMTEPAKPSSRMSTSDMQLTMTEDLNSVSSKISVIMGVAAKLGDRTSSLEGFLRQIASSENTTATIPGVRNQYATMCDALIDSLVDDQPIAGFTLNSCVRTIYIFAAAHPSLITSQKANVLLPYLKNPSTPEELATSSSILKIFSLVIPTMPKTASKFGQELEKILIGFINSPNSTKLGTKVLEIALDTTPCLVAVITHLTQGFNRLTRVLKSCFALFQNVAKINQSPPMLFKLSYLAWIVASLCEHCDFDKLKATKPELTDLADWSEVTNSIYASILSTYKNVNDNACRSCLLHSLGFLFKSYPKLMTESDSAEVLNEVFASADLDAQTKLLRIIQDFLASESQKYAAGDTGASATINMAQFVGNTAEFAESGVGSMIIQTYLPHILDGAVQNHVPLQSAALDIIGFVVHQGLAHPIQCSPTITALETSDNSSLSGRALVYHGILYSKHASLMNVRYMECVRASFEYQLKVKAEAISGVRPGSPPMALLSPWYTLIREKRQTRQEFLKAVLRLLDVDINASQIIPDKLLYFRYVAENFSALPYKTQEEVLTVIRHITMVLSVAGVQVVDTLHVQNEGSADTDFQSSSKSYSLDVARTSVCIGILLLLKRHLKNIYGLTEDKCMKWVPGKKSAVGDKAASVRENSTISWSQLPFVTKPVETVEDASQQTIDLLTLWDTEGVAPEAMEEGDE